MEAVLQNTKRTNKHSGRAAAFRAAVSVFCGLLTFALCGTSMELDRIYHVYFIWSLAFPALIFTAWELPYSILAVLCGPVFCSWRLTPGLGYGNLVFGVHLIAWAVYNAAVRKQWQGKNWIRLYLWQIPYTAAALVFFLLFYQPVMLRNHGEAGQSFLRFVSPMYLRVHAVNLTGTIFFAVAAAQLLQQLPVVRRFLGLPARENEKGTYQAFARIVLFAGCFFLFDSWMNRIYFSDRGIHLSFVMLETGQNIKLTAFLFFLCFFSNYIIESARIREINHQRIQRMNQELEQKVLQRTAELKQAYDDLESYSYTVSHEMRSPVREIEACIEMFEEDNKGRYSEDSLKDIRYAKYLCEDTVSLIGNLMNYAKAGYAILEVQEVDLYQLANTCISELKMSGEGAAMSCRVDPLPTVTGDRLLLHIVFINILSNSFKFTARAENPEIAVWAECSGDEKKVIFQDNGVGFKKEYADKLFVMFNRLHNESDFEGKGIGLATVKRIMERHNGTIEMSGEEGKGCRTVLTFRKLKG